MKNADPFSQNFGHPNTSHARNNPKQFFSTGINRDQWQTAPKNPNQESNGKETVWWK